MPRTTLMKPTGGILGLSDIDDNTAIYTFEGQSSSSLSTPLISVFRKNNRTRPRSVKVLVGAAESNVWGCKTATESRSIPALL